MDSQSPDLNRTFWIGWIVATTIGWIVGMIGAIALSYLVVNIFYPRTTNLIVGVCMGAGFAAGGVVLGVVSGGSLMWLLRNPAEPAAD